MVYYTQAGSLYLLIWEKLSFALGGKGLMRSKREKILTEGANLAIIMKTQKWL